MKATVYPTTAPHFLGTEHDYRTLQGVDEVCGDVLQMLGASIILAWALVRNSPASRGLRLMQASCGRQLLDQNGFGIVADSILCVGVAKLEIRG
jgi:hypothetical protein